MAGSRRPSWRYQGDTVVEEAVDGAVVRRYLLDEGGSVMELIPAGASAGTYLVT